MRNVNTKILCVYQSPIDCIDTFFENVKNLLTALLETYNGNIFHIYSLK